MSALPDNVILLADHRPSDPEPDPPAALARPVRHLRLVDDRDTGRVFRLDTFLARARVVMAEADAGDSAAIVPMHAQPA